MTGSTSMLTLMSWLSPAFPIGGFAYSAGLEQAAHNRYVTDRASLAEWVGVQITQGTLWNDAVILIEAHRLGVATDRPSPGNADGANNSAALAELSELALALCVAQERLRETCDQGKSFLAAVSHWIEPVILSGRTDDTPLPVAVGAAAGLERIDRQLAASAYLHSFVSNQLQCAIRLSLTGQDGAAAVLAGLEPLIARTAERAAQSTLEDLGGAAMMADIASMTHEVLEPRLFLS